MDMTQVFDNGGYVLNVLNENNFEAYFVGGCVRDYLLKREIKDIDITTNARPEVVESLFTKTIDVGKEHGTIIAVINDEPIEVTTYRTETTYTDHRRPDSVYFTESLNEDLERRDFTINAMAMDQQFRVHDPNNGQKDLRLKLIKTVGLPTERFHEDALRMIRALRFSTQLQFTIEEETFHAIRNNAHTIEHVSIERTVAEFKKMYDSMNITDYKTIILDSKLLNYIPVLQQFDKELYTDLKTNTLNEELAIQSYFGYVNLDKLSELRLSNNEVNEIKTIHRILNNYQSYQDPRLLSYDFETPYLKRCLELLRENQSIFDMDDKMLKVAIEWATRLPIKSVKDLALNGRDIMEITKRPAGPWLRDVLKQLVNRVVLEELDNTYVSLSEWVKKNV